MLEATKILKEWLFLIERPNRWHFSVSNIFEHVPFYLFGNLSRQCQQYLLQALKLFSTCARKKKNWTTFLHRHASHVLKPQIYGFNLYFLFIAGIPAGPAQVCELKGISSDMARLGSGPWRLPFSVPWRPGAWRRETAPLEPVATEIAAFFSWGYSKMINLALQNGH